MRKASLPAALVLGLLILAGQVAVVGGHLSLQSVPVARAQDKPAPKVNPPRVAVTLTISGDTTVLVNTLPFTINAPTDCDLYFWSYPTTVTAVDQGASLQVTAAPQGAVAVSMKAIKINWDAHQIETRVGTISFLVSQVPPGPGPGPTPGPAPIPATGLHVLIVYETADLSKLPKEQVVILRSKAIRDYLDAKTPVGPDGKTHEYRIWDKDITGSGDSKLWQDAMARPRASVPWLIVSNGTSGYEGPLPNSVDDTLALLKKFGG